MGAILTWRGKLAAVLVLVAGLVGACGGDAGQADSQVSIVATTPILGDIVQELAGAEVAVTTVIPPGVSPHDFQPSPRDVRAIRSASLLVLNGGGLEEGLLDVIRDAKRSGATTVQAALVALSDPGRAADPHFFTDPLAMVPVVRRLEDLLVDVPGVAATGVRERADAYVKRLQELDDSIRRKMATVPEARRLIVTNHDVFEAFAARYGLQVVGTVIPGATTTGAAAAGELAKLVDTIRRTGAPAIFVDVASSPNLAEAVAAEVEGVQVVGLYTESLAPDGKGPSTYIDMMSTNAQRIVAALR